MSSEKKLPDEVEVSFEGIVDLGTVPPPPGGPEDVHAARTAIAQLPQSLLDDLKHGKEVARSRIQPRFAREFGNEAPTAPGTRGLAIVPAAADVPPPPPPLPPPPRPMPMPMAPPLPAPVPYVARSPSARVAVAAIVVFGVAIFAGVVFLVAIVRSLVHP